MWVNEEVLLSMILLHNPASTVKTIKMGTSEVQKKQRTYILHEKIKVPSNTKVAEYKPVLQTKCYFPL